MAMRVGALLSLGLALLGSTDLAAAEPLLARSDVFEAGQDGRKAYRVPAIGVTASGAILAFAEGRKAGIGDWDGSDIVLRRSTDGGQTWGPLKVVAAGTDRPAHNIVVLADRDSKKVLVLYCVNYARAYVVRSDDEGETFGEPVEITATFEAFKEHFLYNVIATGPCHAIQLKSGRIIVPVWLSNGGKMHRPSAVGVIYSDDHGTRWKAGGLVPNTLVNMSETVALEREDGSVLLNIRSEDREHRRATSISKDGSGGWSKPVFDPALLEPVCNASILRWSDRTADAPGRVLFSNPDNLESHPKVGGDEVNRDRVNLTIKLSNDDGKTWPVSRRLESGISAYSDLAVGKDGTTVFCIYERGGVGNSMWHTRYVSVARFNAEWLSNGKPGGE